MTYIDVHTHTYTHTHTHTANSVSSFTIRGSELRVGWNTIHLRILVGGVIRTLKFTIQKARGEFINPRRACAARVTVVGLCVCLFVCLSVCLSTTILALQATRRLMSDTNSFSATRA